MEEKGVIHRTLFDRSDPALTLHCSCGYTSRFRVYLLNHCYQNDRKGYERWATAMHKQVEKIRKRRAV